MLVAITRPISPSIEHCELTHLPRETIDVNLAKRQHRQYENCLIDLGCKIHRLPLEPELPDSVFVEDTAIVLDELAIITRPGVESRRQETVSVAQTLQVYRKLYHIQTPGTLDGGDVLRIDRRMYVGLSGRSNESGIEQLREFVDQFGYTVMAVEMERCLHLKSAVTQVRGNTLLVNQGWVDVGVFEGMQLVNVASTEPMGGNALLIGGTTVYPEAYVETRQRLENRGITVRTVDMSELAKAEGGVTCCSLILTA
ncbi:MAG: dimethylargininase [Chloroflexi bacterium]|nr:dimethylargininase [Chloroflexota bacterium]